MTNRPFTARLQCVAGCKSRHRYDDILYTCPDCGALLEVRHDLDALRQLTGRDWRKRFSERRLESNPIDDSGVWDKREWVCPELDEENIVTLGEGKTPLLKADGVAASAGLRNLCIKQSGTSHTGSFKDLGMTVLVSVVNQMRRNGKAVQAVACASTGDTSAALAAYCAAAGIPAIVLLPKDKISTAQLIQPIANNTKTFALETDFDGCMQVVRELTASPEIYLANSLNSLRIEGQKTVAMEIIQQLSWEPPDWIIVPGGNLGNVSAIGKGLLEMRALGVIDRTPRLVCAQAERANPLFESFKKNFRDLPEMTARTTLASAIQIGRPVSFRKAVHVLQELDGIVEQAGEQELADACALGDRDGLFTCPQTGVALAACLKLAAKGIIRSGDRVVVISTAHGLKFVDSKVAYHEGKLRGIKSTLANPPIPMAPDAARIRDHLKLE